MSSPRIDFDRCVGAAARLRAGVAVTKLVARQLVAPTFFPLVMALPLAMFVSLAAPLQASILVNGSFEDPLAPAGYYAEFAGGSTGITGWTVVGSDVAIVSTTFAQYGIAFESQDGNQWLDLSGEYSNSPDNGVRQIIPTMIGAEYVISFFVGSAEEAGTLPHIFLPATIDLSIDGGQRESFTNDIAPSDKLYWKQFNHKFTATAATTSITFYNGGAANNYNSALDNVSVTQVAAAPEAASALVWGVLTFGVGAVARLRRES